MKVPVINGTPRKRNTFTAIRAFAQYPGTKENVTCETINLAECRIEPCRGCVAWLDKGEEFCPRKDGVREVVALIDKAEGVVFASPVHAFHLTDLIAAHR